MLSLLTFFACATLSFASSSPLREERLLNAPAGFVNTGATPLEQSITLSFALTSSDISGLENKLLSISTPSSPDFRQWLSADELTPFVRPSPATLSAFGRFTAAHNLSTAPASPHGDWVALTTTVARANALFQADFRAYARAGLAAPLVRTLAFTLPDALVGHVDAVHPTTSFAPDVRPPPIRVPSAQEVDLTRKSVDASCNATITPACLQALYGVPSARATQANNSMMVTGYVEQWAEYADVAKFMRQFRPDMNPNTNFTVQLLDNGTNPQGPIQGGTEAALDVEYAMGLATGVPTTFLSVGGDFITGLLDTTAHVARLARPPTVVSTSYAGSEDAWPPSLLTKLCDGYMALGARGVSVIFASGDGGTRGNHDERAMCANDTFVPVFPAACPWVTAVGATIGTAPERAVNFTGGGFSNVFPAPEWQREAVRGYLERAVPDDFEGVFNREGRAYPDVSLQGWNFAVVVDNATELVAGTSASAPAFAGIVALLNDALLAAGKPALGFLNPWLYTSASGAFTDITEGKNVGMTCPGNTTAFTAAKGWDPLTGWGTPVYPELLAAAML